MKRGVVISLVERGWQAARVCSLDVAASGLECLHIVKGCLAARDARGLIAPVPRVRLISVPRNVFWPAVGLWCARARLAGTLRGILVDNERSYRRLQRWTRWLGIDPWLVKAEGPHYRLYAGAVPLSHVPWSVPSSCASP